MTGEERFKTYSGAFAKNQPQTATFKRKHPSKRELKIAYKAKLKAHPNIKEKLLQNKLPLTHYYVYGDKIIKPKEWQWTAKLWNWI